MALDRKADDYDFILRLALTRWLRSYILVNRLSARAFAQKFGGNINDRGRIVSQGKGTYSLLSLDKLIPYFCMAGGDAIFAMPTIKNKFGDILTHPSTFIMNDDFFTVEKENANVY